MPGFLISSDRTEEFSNAKIIKYGLDSKIAGQESTNWSWLKGSTLGFGIYFDLTKVIDDEFDCLAKIFKESHWNLSNFDLLK